MRQYPNKTLKISYTEIRTAKFKNLIFYTFEHLKRRLLEIISFYFMENMGHHQSSYKSSTDI